MNRELALEAITLINFISAHPNVWRSQQEKVSRLMEILPNIGCDAAEEFYPLAEQMWAEEGSNTYLYVIGGVKDEIIKQILDEDGSSFTWDTHLSSQEVAFSILEASIMGLYQQHDLESDDASELSGIMARLDEINASDDGDMGDDLDKVKQTIQDLAQKIKTRNNEEGNG